MSLFEIEARKKSVFPLHNPVLSRPCHKASPQHLDFTGFAGCWLSQPCHNRGWFGPAFQRFHARNAYIYPAWFRCPNGPWWSVKSWYLYAVELSLQRCALMVAGFGFPVESVCAVNSVHCIQRSFAPAVRWQSPALWRPTDIAAIPCYPYASSVHISAW